MTNPEVRTLIDDIQSCLDGDPSAQMPEVLAASYAGECREVNDRFRRVAEMLAAGSETQALQYAEASPRLLERAIELSFGRELEWQEQCRDQKMDIALLIDAEQLEALQKVYSQGVSSGHPLYKEYRAAALSRDDKKAYELARLIVRMNPSDANALRELARLKKKEAIKLIKRLKEADAAGDAAILLEALEALENVVAPEDLVKEPSYVEGVTRRRQIESDALLAELPGLMDGMESQLSGDSDAWRDASLIHAQLASNLGRLDIRLSDSEDERFSRIESQIDKCRQEVARLARIEGVAREFAALADDVQARSVTPLGIDKIYASQQLQKYLDLERELTALRGNLSRADDSRRSTTRAQLEQSLERAHKHRRLGIVVGSITVLVILVVASCYAFLSSRAAERQKLLVEFRANGQSVAAAELVTTLNEKDAILRKFPGLESELVTTEKWLESLHDIDKQVGRQLSLLEDEAKTGFSNITPVVLHERLVEVGELVQLLPADRSQDASTRLTIIRNDAERHLAERQKDAESKALIVLSEVESSMATIDFEGPVGIAQELVEELLEQILPFAALSDLEAPILRLPGSTESKVAGVSAELQKIHDRVGETQSALEAVSSASTLVSYQTALEQLAGTWFKESAETDRIVEHLPDEKRQRAFLLFRGDLDALAASERLPAGFPKPSAAIQIDRDVINKLQTNLFLNEIWKIRWSEGGKIIDMISKGGLEKREDGLFWGNVEPYPIHYGSVPEFKAEHFFRSGVKIIQNEPSDTIQMMSSLQLGQLLDPTGTEFQKSIIPLIDRVFNNARAEPLAKAYVQNRLFKLLRNRELAWGLHLIPDLREDMEAARELELKSPLDPSDWLLKEKPAWESIWVDYFKERPSRDYYETLKDMLDIIRATAGESVVLVGAVKADGKARLGRETESMIVWGLCDAADGSAPLRVLGESGPGLAPLEIPGDVLPFSPLFGLPIRNDAKRQFLLKLHGLTPTVTTSQN